MKKNTTSNRSDVAGLIFAITDYLNREYVFPDIAKEISKHLKTELLNGTYSLAKTDSEFAKTVTDHMRSVNGDKHLLVSSIPPGRLDPDVDIDAERLERMREHNFGFEQVRILDSNVGYLELIAFIDTKIEGAGIAATKAMETLSDTSCLIIDLRSNGGGSPTMIQLVTTYLFEGDPIHLNSFYFRKTDNHKQFWTLPYVPGKRMPSVPVYVLTSEMTFSGAEEFCYNLKALKRATIVGEKTGGGANPGDFHPLNRGLEIFVPHGRAINPITKTNWEGVGVEPDIHCDSQDALKVALEHHSLAADLGTLPFETRSFPVERS